MAPARHLKMFALLTACVFVLAACGDDGDGILGGLVNNEPATCPLTGVEAPDESVLERRVLSVKIENSPEARPQIGLAEADVIYEQEAEGGITRFNVLYHCNDAERIGPIRSARPVDPAILSQYGDPLFVHAGSVDAVIKDVDAAGIEAINCNFEVDTCPRDPNFEAPHDIFTSSDALRDAGKETGAPPEPVFTFEDEVPQAGRRGRELNLYFSGVANVFWRYRANQGGYLRFHDETPHDLEDGEQVTAANVVVMLVERLETRINDSAGNPVPSFEVVGAGDALVFRDGRLFQGRWERDSEEDVTRLVDRQGNEIPLKPGTTWVELFPTDAPQAPVF
ncbi:MAG TPA: DUF3048 domain-containing protein [Actinomycetota bacterium]|nr:DUF3048 domain-containing protein [Actinomycetota bacterium]